MELGVLSVTALFAVAGIGSVSWAVVLRRRRTAEVTNQVSEEPTNDALRRVRRTELVAWNEGAAVPTAASEVAQAGPEGAAPREVFDALRKPSRAHLAANMFVAVLEIDRFATLRQSIGYKLSNQLVAKLAERIGETVSEVEVGRIGRTTIEFAFAADSPDEAQRKLNTAVPLLERRMTFGQYDFDLSVAIGFADAAATSIREELVDHAAAALVAAQRRRIKVCFADPDLLTRNSTADLDLMRGLTAALQSGEVELHYQPKLEARTNRIRGAEALVRWTRDGQLVPTARFIQVAEETGTIRELTEWVIARAVRDQKTLADQGHPLEISINISAHVLTDSDFADTAMDLVVDAAAPICFEITETAVIDDPDSAFANLHAFRAAGIRIAIDDYGSGLSSLAYLKQLPAHELKIDRMFIMGLTDSHRDPLLVRSSIDLAHALEMEVTAEGVDDPMALQLLRVMGCDLLQGFYISVPLSVEKLTNFLANESHIKRLGESSQEDRMWERFAQR